MEATHDIEQEFGDFWEEVIPGAEPDDGIDRDPDQTKAARNRAQDIEPLKWVCRCWRCRAGGVAVSDMGPMDRILARHLLRMAPADRDRWIEDWAANGNHAVTGKQALMDWIAIEQRERRSEPVYFARKALW